MHHNRGKNMTKRTIYLVNEKYVRLPENIVIVEKRGIIGMRVHQECMP